LRPPLRNDEATTKLLDEQIGDAGNITNASLGLFQQAVNSVTKPIVCVRTIWSSEHHHLGRATAAVRLLNDLRSLCESQELSHGDRILVQAHGQAGLVLALASNLLCPSQITGRPKLLKLLTSYGEESDQPDLVAAITRVEPLLATASLLNGASLDVVTLGTAVRYGWDPSGIGKLLHIVNHRNLRTDGKTWLAKMELPQITMEMPIAWGGDYVQQLAVGGTDAVPATPDAKTVNKALWELLEPYEGFERWLECARKAVRCQNDGRCVLVDYKDSGSASQAKDHLYGHAAYTRMNAILFNTGVIASDLYPTS